MTQEIDAIERWSETEYLAMYLSSFPRWYQEFGIGCSVPRTGPLISRVVASLDVHIASELESEVSERILKSSKFSEQYQKVQDVFASLPPNAGIEDGRPGDLPTQSPLEIWNAIWVIRLTFTHGDGYPNRLTPNSQKLVPVAKSVFDAELLDSGFMVLPYRHSMDAHMARLRLTRALSVMEPWFDDRVS